MKRISVVAFISLFFTTSTLAQTTDSLNTELFGYWKLESVKFKAPVDLNKDGVKSVDALDEYTECEKDQQIQLLEDMTAKRSTGSNAKDCKAVEEAYTWKVVKRTIRDSHYDNGKRIINDHVVLVLILKGPKNESLALQIVKTSKKKLIFKTELRDGTDSTSEAELEYKKTKK